MRKLDQTAQKKRGIRLPASQRIRIAEANGSWPPRRKRIGAVPFWRPRGPRI